MPRKPAIILMAYGSPESTKDIEQYYTHIRGGRRPSSEEVQSLIQRYQAIGGSSPLLALTMSTATKLETRLNDGTRVFAGMKHWHPYIGEVIKRISEEGFTNLMAIALAPHYSKMSIGAYQEVIKTANRAQENRIKLAFVNEWYDDPEFLTRWTKSIQTSLDSKFDKETSEKVFVLFTAHSLPERILTWGDPYKLQLLETAETLAGKLSLKESQYALAFQSAGHTSEPWLGPDILDKLRDLKLAGCKAVLVAPIGFVSDHLEILYDIDIEAQRLCKELGIHLERTDSFNDSDAFIEVLTSVVRSHCQKNP
jgi:ferrochelatase